MTNILSDRELQTLRNWGNLSEEAADEIYALRAALAAQPAEPVAWRVRRHDSPKYWIIFMHKPVDALADPEREVQPLYAAQPAPAAVPPGHVVVPIDPTPEMVAAYLDANTEYWRLVDEQPPKVGIWRNGTPAQATEEAYRAMIAAAGDKP